MNTILQNILYVEDEPDIRLVVKLALEAMAGLHVIGCSSGTEAIAHGARTTTDGAIDLILLDVMMPKMDGPTTLHHLRKIPTLAHTPVIFMTAKAQPDEIAHFKALGALDVIAKPFDPMTLAATLQAIWARFLAEQQPLQPSVDEPVRHTQTLGSSAEERFAARMVLLTAQFQRELPERLNTLLQQWQALQKLPSLDALNALHSTVHNLAGAGSTFGYDELTTRARSLDQPLRVLLTQLQTPHDAVCIESALATGSAARTEINALFAELATELQRILAQLEF